MAQAFARMLGGDSIHAYSAGSNPSGIINPKAIASMQELGYDLTSHDSKSLDEIPDITYDYMITMGCGDACPWVAARHREDWDIPDPRDLDKIEFNAVRDMVQLKIKALLERIKDKG